MRTKFKVVKVIIVLALTLALVPACAGWSVTGKKPASPVLDRIVDRGELVVGTAGSMPPLNMTTKQGKIIGLEADLAKLMASALDVELRFETMPFSDLLTALEDEEVDMVLSGMTITAERNQKVAFVGPYMINGKSFITKIKTLAATTDISQVNNKEVKLAALNGSTSQEFVKALAPNALLLTPKDYDEAVSMVLHDEAQALVADLTFCILTVLRNPGKGLLTMTVPLTYEPIGIALPPDDPLLVNWVMNFLISLDGSGELDELKAFWFKNAVWLSQL